MPRVPPPEVVAAWPKPNYENPANRGHYLIAVEVVLFFLTAVVVLGRIYTRRWLIRSFGWDDWFIIPACIFCLALTISTCLATTAGYGIHIYEIPHHLRTVSLEYAWANMLLYCICVTLTKVSILCFYFRLVQNGPFRILTWVTLVAVIGLGIAYALMVIFYCVPVQAYWNPLAHPDAKCLSDGAALISNAAVNIFLDCWLWIMPVPIVWSVHLPLRQRIGLVAVFALGFFVCLAGAMRMYYVVQTAYSYDPTWDGFSAWIWSAAESDVGIICASLPALKPLVTKVTKFRFSEATPSIYGNPSKPRTRTKRTMNRKTSVRLPSRAMTVKSKNQLDSIWDGSDEVICERNNRNQVYQMSTVVFSGDPDGRMAATRKSYFHERGAASKDNLTVQVKPIDEDGSSFNKDLEAGRGSDEHANTSCWDVMKTTEIEVREDHSFDEERNASSLSVDSLGRRQHTVV
ncbi:hypothetical protein ABW19_dt0209601 [Dactylella cylindrospora]|nr:hypothetical protein ABW19_dt0209601 [Dactylella cylindrospora]